MSAVISLRVPKELKEELEKLKIDYINELRRYLKELVRKKRAEILKREMDKLRMGIPRITGNMAAELIREDRDVR